ncbi:MAG: carotenoid biosynthesis protein [Myxococcota bacterium]
MPDVVSPDAPWAAAPSATLELACLAIVALYVLTRAPKDSDPRGFLVRLAALMAASWLAEDACIRLYGFYGYSPHWSLFVDKVPLLIVTIWPVVIHSAWDLARQLAPRRALVPLVGAGIVLTDASLIEPIAVQAGLWRWYEPGLFAVPPVGILGWALFALLALAVLERTTADPRPGTPRLALASLFPIAGVGVHLLLLAAWWGALRWVNHEVPPWPVVGLAWAVSLGLAARALETGAGRGIPRFEMLLRVPAAVFFFVLLALHGAEQPALIAYALAFAPPYLVLTAQAWSAARQPAPATG